MTTIGGGGAGTFSSGAFSFVFLCDDEAFELFEDDEDEELLDDDELLELLDLDDCVSPDFSGFAGESFGPSMSSSNDLMQPLMSLLMSRSLLDPSPSKLVSIFDFFY